jgi:formamidopyrimidine-DNA glycosylase
MPELPEIETIRRGLEPLLTGHTLTGAVVRVASLRRPLAGDLGRSLTGAIVGAVERRGKYLLLRCSTGTLILHLGMSGHLHLVERGTAPGRHDHLDLLVDAHAVLRLTDPRRFGTVLWTGEDPLHHPLLAGLGPEPFAAALSGAYFEQQARGRRLAIKSFLMDQKTVAGIGNIYASESLFVAGLDPRRHAGTVTLQEYDRLYQGMRTVLAEAIALGATTLDDFGRTGGKPGYFPLRSRVYGRAGEPCAVCGAEILTLRQGGRATFFCPFCQS